MNCLWKSVNDFISVSNCGDVKSHGKLIKGEICKNGYRRIHVSYKGVSHKFLVHRLVAEAFIPNPENKPCVNHIDGNKLNNCVKNLEWCDNSHNQQHAYDVGLKKKKLSSTDRKFICENYIPGDKRYSTRALARMFDVSQAAIRQVLLKGGGVNHVKG